MEGGTGDPQSPGVTPHACLGPVLAGVPMLTVCVWVVTRLQYDNHG